MDVADFLRRSFNIKIFSLNRIRYEELWEDALSEVKKTYAENDNAFNSSSPFSQLLSVMLHLGRMIIYYIEDAITGLNIRTAWRPDQIRGLARLTGHDPSRALSARAAVKLYYNPTNADAGDYEGLTVYIPNKLSVTNTFNGLSYVIMFSADNAKILMKNGNYINCTMIQGNVKYQIATSDGTELQSFNFAERNYNTIEQHYIVVYVNGERWDIVAGLTDMSYNQKAVIVKTGQTGGLDVYFGNGDMGMIPPAGASIICEYIVTGGANGNMSKDFVNSGNYWEFNAPGYLSDGTQVPLLGLFSIKCLTDIILGSNYEDIVLTQEIAPYTNRSMVLANATNYKYYLKKMNMFSIVDVIQGFNTINDAQAESQYQKAQYNYTYIKSLYRDALNNYGGDSDMAEQLLGDLKKAATKLKRAGMVLKNARLDDNTVYLFLIPKIANRITSSANYFTCDESTAFNLTNDEKYNILNLIEQSGQCIISVENRIMNPLFPRFAINIAIRSWQGYEYSELYNAIIERLSTYFINCTRRDRIPISDIVALIEDLNGIDSVSVYFDADPNNKALYGNEFNGIDEYGDVVLERTIANASGNEVVVRDLYPLFRGGFTNEDGVEYGTEQSAETLGPVNISLVGTSYEHNSVNIQNKAV